MVISALLAGETIAGPARIDPTEPQAPPAPALKVLLADDNHINRLLGQSVLKSLGHVVESAENGREAIARVTEAMVLEQPYDVILMDLHMPEIDGFEAIAAIRALETRSDHHVMIIALTADATAESSRRALQSGADHSMTKPIEQDVLKTILASRPSIAATGQRLAHRRQALDQADFR